MRWGNGTLKWVRPLHSIICLMSDEGGATVVPLEVDGITAGNSTRGHRFLAPDAITVAGFEDYEAKLKRAFVVLNPQERADAIWHDATNAAFAAGMEVVEDAGLLAEVAGLVEWPVVLMGPIADDFLDLPPEVLQTSMREHQKFFSVKNPKTGRIEKFITVANRTTADEGATILAGNEKGAVGAAVGRQVLLGKRPARGDIRKGDGDLGQGVGKRHFPQQAGHPGRADRPHGDTGP